MRYLKKYEGFDWKQKQKILIEGWKFVDDTFQYWKDDDKLQVRIKVGMIDITFKNNENEDVFYFYYIGTKPFGDLANAKSEWSLEYTKKILNDIYLFKENYKKFYIIISSGVDVPQHLCYGMIIKSVDDLPGINKELEEIIDENEHIFSGKDLGLL